MEQTPHDFKYKSRVPIRLTRMLPWTRPNLLAREISPTDTVLDLGCGPYSSLRTCPVSYSLGVELFDPYFREAQRTAIHNEYLKADVREVKFEPASFDVVLALDILDNLEKEEAYQLVARMKAWARKKVIITVPNGYIPEGALDDNPLQIHVSGYSTEDLKGLGFSVYGMGLKLPQWLVKLHEGQRLIGFLLIEVATYPLSLFTWRHPKASGELVGVYQHEGQ